MKYAVCEEIVDGILTECFTVRVASDTSPYRFMVHGYYDTYEEAHAALAMISTK